MLPDCLLALIAVVEKLWSALLISFPLFISEFLNSHNPLRILFGSLVPLRLSTFTMMCFELYYSVYSLA